MVQQIPVYDTTTGTSTLVPSTQVQATDPTAAPRAVAQSPQAAAMVDEVTGPRSIVDLNTATSSYGAGAKEYPAVVNGALAAPFRYLIGDPGVQGSNVLPYAQPVGAAARALDSTEALAVAFDTDGTSFELRTSRSTSDTAFRVWVDEQQSATVPLPAAAGQSRYKVTLGAARANHRVVVEFDKQSVFTGVTVASTDSVTYPSDTAPLRLAVIGDSYAWGQGYQASSWSARSYFTTLARALGFAHYRRFAAPGTGLVATGSYSAYAARLAAVIAYPADVVVIQGSINDNGQSGVQAAAAAAIATVRAGLPNARIVLTGVLRSYGPTAADATTNTALAAAATAAGVPFVDTSGWFTGTGSVVSPNGTGNSDVYNYQFSQDHPSPAGHRFLGRQLAREVARLLGIPAPAAVPPAAAANAATIAAGPAMSPLSGGGEVVADRDKVNSNGVTLTSGTIVFSGARVATKTETVIAASIGTGGTAAAGATFAGYGVYEVADDNSLTLVASTASNASLWGSSFQTNAPSGTVNTKQAFQAPFVKQAGKRYTVGHLFVGTTAPVVYGMSGVSLDAVSALVAPFQGALLAGQTGFPAAIAGSALTGKQAFVPAPLLLTS